MTATPVFRFDNSYARDLHGMSVPWQPAPSPAPRWLRLNRDLATALGLDADALASPEGLAVLSGNALPEGAAPVAQAYAGHQFGGFSPQLGDGRALLLGEQIDPQGRRFDIAFKGSGRTPFSRGGDGKAALGPVLREYLMGEAMHALGIPTSRALAAVATGEPVLRERPLPGALLTRVASSHVRVGTFQFFAARRDTERVRRLADHVIARHDPALLGQPDRYLALLRAVCERQASLLARWMGVGFIHGVMNTDNMTLSGETIDYGPCAFMEAYDPACVFSSIDTQGRYAYGNQPGIAQWNLARLAETLVPLIDPDAEQAVAQATEVLNGFAGRYGQHWLAVMRAKLGLADSDDRLAGASGWQDAGAPADATDAADAADRALVSDYLNLLQQQAVDFTLAFRRLSEALRGRPEPLQRLFGAAAADALPAWLARWHSRLQAAGRSELAVADAMDAVNPVYIPRNHQVERALEAAVESDDLAPFETLLGVITQPYHERPGHAAYAEPAPPELTAGYRTFCGT